MWHAKSSQSKASENKNGKCILHSKQLHNAACPAWSSTDFSPSWGIQAESTQKLQELTPGLSWQDTSPGRITGTADPFTEPAWLHQVQGPGGDKGGSSSCWKVLGDGGRCAVAAMWESCSECLWVALAEGWASQEVGRGGGLLEDEKRNTWDERQCALKGFSGWLFRVEVLLPSCECLEVLLSW